jgi:hypothetical protein
VGSFFIFLKLKKMVNSLKKVSAIILEYEGF